MLVSDEEKRLVAQAIQLKRRLVQLRHDVEQGMRANQGGQKPQARRRLDGKPLDPETLPPPLREKYLLYQQTMSELNQLRGSLSPELRNLVDPQVAC